MKNIYEEMGIDPIDPKIIEEFDNLPKEKVVLSKKFKRKMNRLFREELGIDRIPHPEVDNFYERFRSELAIAFRKDQDK